MYLAVLTVHIVNLDGDPQEEYHKLYRVMAELLDTYFPERTVTITSADPPYCTPAIKYMLRRKNRLMRSGRVEKAGALALKIGEAITKFNSAELSRVDVLSDSRSMWSKVRQLTGRSKSSSAASRNSAITADLLNRHYAAVSTDANYTAPSVKATANNSSAATHITNLRLFNYRCWTRCGRLQQVSITFQPGFCVLALRSSLPRLPT